LICHSGLADPVDGLLAVQLAHGPAAAAITEFGDTRRVAAALPELAAVQARRVALGR
jgi:hypothetical protein